MTDCTNRLGGFLTSDRLGVIDRVRERRVASEGGASFDFVSEAAHPDPLPADLHAVYGGGARARSHARAAAIGEAVERYALSIGPGGSQTLRTIAEVPEAACDPTDLHWFLEAQYAQEGFPFRRPEATWRYRWVFGRSLLGGRPTALPASLVHLPYRCAPGERATSFQTSVGTSCAGSAAEAATRAILELVERDALTICWESHVPFPPIADEAVQDACDRGARARREPFRILAFDLTTDLAIPVVLALALARHQGPAVAIGSAADLDPRRSLERAIAEAVTSWRSAAAIGRSDSSADALLEPQSGRSAIIRHTAYYTQPAGLRHFAFLLNGAVPPRRPTGGAIHRPASEAARLSECAALLRKAALDVVLFDMTPPDLAGSALHVVRAVALRLVRPTIGSQARHLSNPRIRDVPYRLGLVPKPISIDRLLRQWHPAP